MPANDNPDSWQALAQQVCAEREPQKLESLIHKLLDALDREHPNQARPESKAVIENELTNSKGPDPTPYLSFKTSAVYQDQKDEAC